MIAPKNECDEHGVPLDWEKCRYCAGTGEAAVVEHVVGEHGPCVVCGGHGSLRAATLWEKAFARYVGTRHVATASHCGCIVCQQERPIRCEDCGHPMSEGTWELTPGLIEGRGIELRPNHGMALHELRAGREPEPMPMWPHVHYSRCDEKCEHEGPGRFIGGAGEDDDGTIDFRTSAGPYLTAGSAPIEASWRQVDIRFKNGWPHDLRPENLMLLCTRCEAERSYPNEH